MSTQEDYKLNFLCYSRNLKAFVLGGGHFMWHYFTLGWCCLWSWCLRRKDEFWVELRGHRFCYSHWFLEHRVSGSLFHSLSHISSPKACKDCVRPFLPLPFLFLGHTFQSLSFICILTSLCVFVFSSWSFWRSMVGGKERALEFLSRLFYK